VVLLCLKPAFIVARLRPPALMAVNGKGLGVASGQRDSSHTPSRKP
jgi:hypothetical protein